MLYDSDIVCSIEFAGHIFDRRKQEPKDWALSFAPIVFTYTLCGEAHGV